jgi:hypothetical protein
MLSAVELDVIETENRGFCEVFDAACFEFGG